jgi:hypothetical protein
MLSVASGPFGKHVVPFPDRRPVFIHQLSVSGLGYDTSEAIDWNTTGRPS